MVSNPIIKIFLFPIYILFKIIVWFKNKLYDYQLLKSFSPPIYTICIGNLAVGGTGKTPFVEFLSKYFLEKYKIAILSRGYGRKSKGFIEASLQTNASEIGDEPFQYYLKFGEKINVFVGKNRVFAAEKIINLYPKTELLILDDAFQHRRINAHFNIILTEYNRLISSDMLLPLGRLREPIGSLSRASTLIITKCPNDFNEKAAIEIKSNFGQYFQNLKQVYFTSINYQPLVQFNGNSQIRVNKIVLVTGLANASILFEYCNTNWEVIKHFDYPDHQEYTIENILKFTKIIKPDISLIVSEKDYVKLKDILPENINAYYVPIEIEFLFDKKDQFLNQLNQRINTFYQK